MLVHFESRKRSDSQPSLRSLATAAKRPSDSRATLTPSAPARRSRLRLPINIPDVLEEIYREGRELINTLRWGREVSRDLALSGAALVQAEVLLSALECRLAEIRELTKNPSSPQLLRALALLDTPLLLEHDSEQIEVDPGRVKRILDTLFEQEIDLHHQEQIAS